jgi:hypothetical protein
MKKSYKNFFWLTFSDGFIVYSFLILERRVSKCLDIILIKIRDVIVSVWFKVNERKGISNTSVIVSHRIHRFFFFFWQINLRHLDSPLLFSIDFFLPEEFHKGEREAIVCRSIWMRKRKVMRLDRLRFSSDEFF